ncbi:hypothetical protein Tco_1138321 [Tanacetum coccineum]
MIGSLMYLTASRHDIMFAVCACSRFQVTSKSSHLSGVKRIFRYLKGKPKLSLWYPRVSSFNLEAYTDSDYAGANLDRNSTTRVYHSKTKHIAIRHHFIRDAYEKKLIQVLKIHTDDNVADLLTKAFDVSSSLGFRESLGRALDGTEALMLPKLFILWLATVSTDSADMVVLESCPKNNMVAYLEKTDGNTEFHEIVSFLTYITAKVAGKPVSISETSIRSDLLFDDADRIDFYQNGAIFDVIHAYSSKSTSWDQIPTNIATALKNVLVPLDHFPINALTSKVLSFMVKKGKHFSGKLTPLFFNMLVQPTEVEGEQSERPSELQLTPSPPHLSEVHVEPQSDPSPRPSPTSHIPDSIPESSGGNHGDQAKEIKHLKAQIKKLKKKAKPVITHHKAWMKSVSMKQRLAGKKSLKTQWMQKESLDDDEIDYMETGDAQDVGRTRYVVHEEKQSAEKEVITEDALGTDKQKDNTDKEKDSTDKEKDSTDRPDEGTVDQTEGISATPTTPTHTPTTFGDDETIAQVLLNTSQAKAVSRELLLRLAQRRFLAEQRAIAIRNKPPTRTQLRNQMMTYLKHVGNKKHSDLKNKTFEEIQALYEKVKRFDESFTVVGSIEDERRIKEMNEGVKDPDQKSLKKRVVEETPKKEDTTKVPAKVDVTE